jgi:CBS domain-containing protein/GGDEF domain-containing protein
VLALILAGGALLCVPVSRAFSLASLGLRAEPGDDSGLRDQREEENRNLKKADESARAAQDGRALAFCLLLWGTVLLGTIGGLTFRALSKKRQTLPPPKLRDEEGEIKWTHLNVKRELLWRRLMADQDLVLQNRIEVRHVMTEEPLTVCKSTSGKQVGELFAKHQIQHLVVCEGDQRIVGVVKASDYRANPQANAETLMTPPHAVVSSKTMLGAAISQLFEQDDSFLPVVDGERLCGVLTPTDLALTLHCSLQLWFRVAQSMQGNATREADLEATSDSIGDIARQFESRLGRLPEQVKTAIATGSSAAVDAELNKMIASVSQLMQQLEDARAKIRKQNSDIAQLREPSPDTATGAVSRAELDRILGALLAGGLADSGSLSLILYVAAAANAEQLPRQEKQKVTDEHLRLAVQHAADCIESTGTIARYRDDTLAIVLPGRGIDGARELGARLSESCRGGRLPFRMSIVSVRRGESSAAFLQRAESSLARSPGEREPVAVASALG